MIKVKRILSLALCIVISLSVCACANTTVITTSESFTTAESEESSNMDQTTTSLTVNSSDTTSKEVTNTSTSKISSTSSKEPVSSEKTPTFPEQIKVNVPNTFNGFYGDPGIVVSPVANLWSCDYVNCTILTASDLDIKIKMCVNKGIFFWINMAYICEAGIDPTTKQMKIQPNWRENMQKVADTVKQHGAWNYFLGWYMDEPLLNKFTPENVYMFTEYNHFTFGKRYFICFAVEGIAPECYSEGIIPKSMSKETTKYLTDCAYDMYWDFDKWEDKYKKINSLMKSRVPDNCKIWYIPWAYGDVDPATSTEKPNMKKMAENEEKYIKHLNGMYNFLKQEQNPGGMFTFIFRGKDLNFYGIEEMVQQGHWTNYFDLVKKYGKELVENK